MLIWLVSMSLNNITKMTWPGCPQASSSNRWTYRRFSNNSSLLPSSILRDLCQTTKWLNARTLTLLWLTLSSRMPTWCQATHKYWTHKAWRTQIINLPSSCIVSSRLAWISINRWLFYNSSSCSCSRCRLTWALWPKIPIILANPWAWAIRLITDRILASM